ncbi:MAG: peptidoglycan-binding protein [bacterium]|nr:peptidoglycan-binding protein [bacterium]
MLKKIAFGGLGLLFLASPLFASSDTLSDLQAQVQSLLTQITALRSQLGVPANTTPASTSACVSLSNSLSVDDTDADTNGEVTKLQQFLASYGPSIYPEARITGYFGPATMRAVQRWQAAHGVVSSGDPDSTGYGFVGSRTRTAMARLCYGMEIPENTAEARAKGRDARRIADIKQLQLALELYYDDKGMYPPTTSFLAPDYIASVPIDVSDNNSYSYDQLGGGRGYELGASLENRSSALDYDNDVAPSQGNLWTGSDSAGCRGEQGRYCYDVGETSDYVVDTSSSITITYPNGGESLVFGSGKDVDLRVNWIAHGVVGSAGVFLVSPTISCNIGTVAVSAGTYGFYMGPGYVCPNTGELLPGGQYKVALTTGNVRDESNGYFTVVNAPSTDPVIISTSAKAAGNLEVDAGGEVSIYGNNLATVDSTKVFFSGIPATVTWTSETRVNADVPSSLIVGQSYDLYVVNQYGTSNSVRVKVLSNLVQPVTITFPTPGAQLYAGQTYRITWTGSDVGVKSYSLRLLGGIPYGSIDRSLGTAYSSGLQGGSFTWTIPSELAGGNFQNYQILFSGNEATAGQATAMFGIGYCSSYCY